ncbi:MAG: ABC transporter substrate-binding protein [Cyanobium sp. ELA507]
MQTDPVKLDPHTESNASNTEANELIYESLAEFDPKDLSIKPTLAESWENPDPLTWIFKLRKGTKFHDGKELDAGAWTYGDYHDVAGVLRVHRDAARRIVINSP